MIETFSGSRNLTIADVAKELGVSRATVSMAFSGKGTITAKRREEVLLGARKLGYEPNPLAQRLRGRATNTIALYSPAIDASATVKRVQHIQTLLNGAGFEVQLHAQPYESAFGGEPASLLRSIRLEKPRAIICNAGWHFGEAEANELRTFQADGGVVACLCYKQPFSWEFDQVVHGGARETKQAIGHLAQLGHRRFGLIAHDLEDAKASMERDVFLSEAKRLGLEVQPQWLFAAPLRFDWELGAQAAAQFLSLARRPTAVIASPDSTATAFLHHLLRAGVQVPRDLSLVSLADRGESALHAAIPISAVSDPYLEQSNQMVDFLLQRLQGQYDGPGRVEWVYGSWLARQSTSPPGEVGAL